MNCEPSATPAARPWRDGLGRVRGLRFRLRRQSNRGRQASANCRGSIGQTEKGMDGRLPGTDRLGPRIGAAATSSSPAPPPPPARPLSVDNARRTAQTRKTAKPIRPNDVADWRRDDYYSAKRDNDPRLAAAVAYLGRRFQDKRAAAELLTGLLESPADTLDAEGRTNRVPTPNPRLTEAVIVALAANGTPLARETLKRLVTGNLRTGAPQVAATAAVKAILRHPCRKRRPPVPRRCCVRPAGGGRLGG